MATSISSIHWVTLIDRLPSAGICQSNGMANETSQSIPAISLLFTKLKMSLFDTHQEEIDAEDNNVQQEQNESDDPCQIDEIFSASPRNVTPQWANFEVEIQDK